MQQLYEKITEYILESGKRIREKSGNIEDIGRTKQYLTEEDIIIERGLKEIIKNFDPSHEFCAEEENDRFAQAEHVWVVDPISGTQGFIAGLPHYGIVVAHVQRGQPVFAVVYDPSMDELFTAIKGQGAFLNGKKISVLSNITYDSRILLNIAFQNIDVKLAQKFYIAFADYNLCRNRNSFAVNYCHVACGRYTGIAALGKDSFTEFAGKLILEESGGILTNKEGEETIKFTDRVFVGGNKDIYPVIKERVDKIFE